MEAHETFLALAGVCATALEMKTIPSVVRTKARQSVALREIVEVDMDDLSS
jgi:hypothetical protein